MGRPRKNPKISSFFEIKGAKKKFKKVASSRDCKKGQEYFPEERKIVPMLRLAPHASSGQTKTQSQKNQLVNQIIEVGEFMGLINPEEKKQAAELISNIISD